jgi:hypothetical protein
MWVKEKLLGKISDLFCKIKSKIQDSIRFIQKELARKQIFDANFYKGI